MIAGGNPLVAAGLSVLLAITHIDCTPDVAGEAWGAEDRPKVAATTRADNHECMTRDTWTY